MNQISHLQVPSEWEKMWKYTHKIFSRVLNTGILILNIWIVSLKGRATVLVTGTVPPEGLLCSCSISCSHSPLAFQPITTWFDCQRSPSRAFCRTGHLSPYLSRSQSRACSAGCLASETRRAGGSSSPCRLWTARAWCDSRCRPPPSRRRAALHTRASLSSTSPSQRTLTEPLLCFKADCAPRWIPLVTLCLRCWHRRGGGCC